MSNVVGAIAVIAKLVSRAIRWLALMLLRLSRLLARQTGRGSLAFFRASSETKSTTVAALAGIAGGVVLSPFVDITVMGMPVSSPLVLGALGLLIGMLVGYAIVKKIRTLGGGSSGA